MLRDKITIERSGEEFKITVDCPCCFKPDTKIVKHLAGFIADIPAIMEGKESSIDISSDSKYFIIKVEK